MKSPTGRNVPPPTTKQITIAAMPKSKGNGYFVAAQKGAEDAARELASTLFGTAPPTPILPSKAGLLIHG